MPNVAEIQAVQIFLKTGEEQSLFILLAADGSINRQGTGAVDNDQRDLFIGMTKEPLFEKLMKSLDDEMLNYMGGYDIPEQQGVPCDLAIGFSFADGESNGFRFRYGSKSQGPPREIVDFVTAAVQLTDPWFEEQIEMVKNSK